MSEEQKVRKTFSTPQEKLAFDSGCRIGANEMLDRVEVILINLSANKGVEMFDDLVGPLLDELKKLRS